MLRIQQVLAATGKGLSGWYQAMGEGLAPRGVAIGRRAVAWPSDEIEALIDSWLAGKSEDEIRSMVRGFHAARPGGISQYNPDAHLRQKRTEFFEKVARGEVPAPRSKKRKDSVVAA
jgi:prophage regulatory protein